MNNSGRPCGVNGRTPLWYSGSLGPNPSMASGDWPPTGASVRGFGMVRMVRHSA